MTVMNVLERTVSCMCVCVSYCSYRRKVSHIKLFSKLFVCTNILLKSIFAVENRYNCSSTNIRQGSRCVTCLQGFLLVCAWCKPSQIEMFSRIHTTAPKGVYFLIKKTVTFRVMSCRTYRFMLKPVIFMVVTSFLVNFLMVLPLPKEIYIL